MPPKRDQDIECGLCGKSDHSIRECPVIHQIVQVSGDLENSPLLPVIKEKVKRKKEEVLSATSSTTEARPLKTRKKAVKTINAPPSFIGANLASSSNPQAAKSIRPIQSSSSASSSGARANNSIGSGWSGPTTQELRDEAIAAEPDNAEEDDDVMLIKFAELQIKVVGIRYYTGLAMVGEGVGLKREPTNKFDRNAIKVVNSVNEQVGHIPRDAAYNLAPLIDNGKILIEGTITGYRNTYDLPIRIDLFSRVEDTHYLMGSLQFKLPLVDFRTRMNAIIKAEAARAAAQAAHKAADDWKQLVGHGQQMNEQKSQKVMDSIGYQTEDLAKLPEAKQPTALATRMLSYQLQGLQWLINQEHPSKPSKEQPNQFWVVKNDINAGTVYSNIFSGISRKEAPTLARGAVLADDMGLGKTLQTIALILSDHTGNGLVEDPVASNGSFSNATLIVTPLSTIGNWMTQFSTHVSSDHILNIYVFHGPQRVESPAFLSKQDVVITTYAVLAQQDSKSKKGLFGVKWRRVVLDEGHIIKNAKTKTAEACFALEAERRIILTGTPIQNNVDDLFSVIKFLRINVISEKEWWTRYFTRPLKGGDPDSINHLKILMRSICLRRTKDMQFDGRPILSLPPIQSFVHRVEFPPAIRSKYNAIEAEAKKLFNELANRGEGEVMKSYSNILAFLTRLRQCCNHESLVGETLRSILEGDVKMNENAKALVEALLRAVEDCEDCCICLETLEVQKAAVTPCKHVFDKACIEQVIVRQQAACPLCRQSVSKDQLVVAPPPQVENDEDVAKIASTDDTSQSNDGFTSSPKIDALLALLKASHAADPTTKSVVFSQWTSFLDIVEKGLERHEELKFVRLDGTMPRKNREAAIERFQRDPQVVVFLISLKAGSLGLNLTAANQCFLLDPWWNPSIEDQAVDRIYRLGQTRETKIFRLVIKDTIEDRVIELQEKKRRLMAQAFGEKCQQDERKIREARTEDLRALLAGPAPAE